MHARRHWWCWSNPPATDVPVLIRRLFFGFSTYLGGAGSDGDGDGGVGDVSVDGDDGAAEVTGGSTCMGVGLS